MQALGDELEARRADDDAHHPSIYLIINALQRFRDLRRSEDDFSFSFDDDKKDGGGAKPDKLLADLLREGPALGVHTLIWCDTVNTIERSLDRSALREFENRVLFQMSQADSSFLIDSPLAARLGLKRALFYSEEHGLAEKFRPYAMPPEEWIERVSEILRGRA